ncbi:hypothetical protein SHJG_6528 [Streptomyces hygroscopicus subsp. jinggangensis 5008]|nr:hypothetical protein SHJG_6528 [Streptomyces hygroscopicus subsp. jinggangensis 5008]AGF65951.1 hypothetical protein SHJGH_6288 [Streptomyces hygroscopicus subsp. jinggangensis TL01]
MRGVGGASARGIASHTDSFCVTAGRAAGETGRWVGASGQNKALRESHVQVRSRSHRSAETVGLL